MRIFAILLAAGVVIGVALAAAGAVLGGSVAADASADVSQPSPTTTTVAAAEPAWIPEGGHRFESTILVPQRLEAGDGEVVFTFALHSITQTAGGFASGRLPAAYPERWILTTTAGEQYETETNPPRLSFDDQAEGPSLASALFDVPEGLSRADIAEVRLVQWRVAAPLRYPLTMDATPGATVQLSDGTVITLNTILEQSNGTILSFGEDEPADLWYPSVSGFFAPIIVSGRGSGWRSSQGSLAGGFQLTWLGPETPDPIELEANHTHWVARQGLVVIPVEEITGG